MKLFKKALLFAFFGVMAIQTSAFAADEVIDFEQLPQNAQLLIKDNFNNLTVARVTFDADLDDNNYEVVLSDSSTIEFDKEGNWTEIECEDCAVPANLVPEAITKYVAEKYSDAIIKKIEKEATTTKVTLSNETEIEFNDNFEVIETEAEEAE